MERNNTTYLQDLLGFMRTESGDILIQSINTLSDNMNKQAFGKFSKCSNRDDFENIIDEVLELRGATRAFTIIVNMLNDKSIQARIEDIQKQIASKNQDRKEGIDDADS